MILSPSSRNNTNNILETDTMMINMETVEMTTATMDSKLVPAEVLSAASGQRESAMEQARRTMLLHKAGSPTNKFSHFGFGGSSKPVP